MVDALLLATAVACGLNGGVFFAFSTFVMAGLGRLRPAEGVRAMQAVNLTAVTPAFMTLFLGTAALSVATGAWAVLHGEGVALAGALVQLVGGLGVTAAVNVPLNNRLATLDSDEAGAAKSWDAYRSRWVRWNHLRTAAGALACGLLVVALVQR